MFQDSYSKSFLAVESEKVKIFISVKGVHEQSQTLILLDPRQDNLLNDFYESKELYILNYEDSTFSVMDLTDISQWHVLISLGINLTYALNYALYHKNIDLLRYVKQSHIYTDSTSLGRLYLEVEKNDTDFLINVIDLFTDYKLLKSILYRAVMRENLIVLNHFVKKFNTFSIEEYNKFKNLINIAGTEKIKEWFNNININVI